MCQGEREIYLALVEEEAKQVQEKIKQAEEGQDESRKRLLAMLMECAVVLRLAGVESGFRDDQEETLQLPLLVRLRSAMTCVSPP